MAREFMSKGRLEAFSDGVIAIAATLLVLDIHVPSTHGEGALARALGHQWPGYVSYAVSFLTIGIIWINHHQMIERLRSVNHSVLFLNILLLLCIGLLPFSTALMAAYLTHHTGEGLAAAIYAGSFLAMSVTFLALNYYTLLARPDLLHGEITAQQRMSLARRGGVGLVPYVVATALAPLSPYVTIAICGLVAFYYALPLAGLPAFGAGSVRRP